MSSPRLAWAMTGSGHYIEQCVEFLLTLPQVDLYLSAAAEEVLKMYRIDLNLLKHSFPVYRDKSASSPPVGLFYKNYYQCLIIAPTTSNTVAKMTLGIADNLVTNLYAQAGKCKIPAIVYPCDIEPEMETTAPNGKVMVYPRPVDLAATAQLRQMSYTQVVNNISELITAVQQHSSGLL